MRRSLAAIVPILALVVCAACREHGPPEAADSGVSAHTVEELRIGVAEGPDEYLFGQVIDVAEGTDGSIFVADRQPMSVRRYSSSGDFLSPVGRQGQGPGEYSQIVALRLLPDGRLAVRDVGNARILFYDSDGEYLDAVQVGGSWGDRNDFAYDRDGNLYVLDIGGGASYLRTITTDGERLERIPLPDANVRQQGETFVIRTPEDHLEMFPVVTLWAWSPEGYLVTGRNDRYAIEIRPPGPDVVLSRDVPAARFRPEERAQLEAWIEYVRKQLGGDPQMVALPDVKPYYRRLDVDADGHVWVWRYVEAEEREVPLREPVDNPPLTWVHPITYDVFTPTGASLGTVTLPERTRALVLGTSSIWGVSTDEDGIEHVVRLRVSPALTEPGPQDPRDDT